MLPIDSRPQAETPAACTASLRAVGVLHRSESDFDLSHQQKSPKARVTHASLGLDACMQWQTSCRLQDNLHLLDKSAYKTRISHRISKLRDCFCCRDQRNPSHQCIRWQTVHDG